MQAVIPAKRNRIQPMPHDTTLYKTRNRIERTFQRGKINRRRASRFDRKERCLSSFAAISCSLIWLDLLKVDST
jgi:transposase